MRICGKISTFDSKIKLTRKLTANLAEGTWLKAKRLKNAAQIAIRAAKQISYPYAFVCDGKKKQIGKDVCYQDNTDN